MLSLLFVLALNDGVEKRKIESYLASLSKILYTYNIYNMKIYTIEFCERLQHSTAIRIYFVNSLLFVHTVAHTFILSPILRFSMMNKNVHEIENYISQVPASVEQRPV